MSDVVTVKIPNDMPTRFRTLAGDAPGEIEVKLGAVLGERREKTVLHLADYLREVKATRPAVDYYTKSKASWSRMYLNDRYGCCVITGKYHQMGVWTGNDAPFNVHLVNDNVILQMYNRLKAGPGDSGCIISDVLDYWRDKGLPDDTGALSKIDGYCRFDNTNVEQTKAAIDLFGGGTIGFMVPPEWMSVGHMGDWTLPASSRRSGGHDVDMVGYDDKGVWVATWAGLRRITWAAWTSRANLIVECYAHIGPQWWGDDKVSGGGVDVTKLRTDLALVKSGGIPDVTPTPVPPPVPPAPVPPVPPPSGKDFTGVLNFVQGRLQALPAAKVDRAEVEAVVREVMSAALRDAESGKAAIDWEALILRIVEAILKKWGV